MYTESKQNNKQKYRSAFFKLSIRGSRIFRGPLGTGHLRPKYAAATALHVPVTITAHHPPRDDSSSVPYWPCLVSRLLCIRHEPLQHRVESICGVRRRPDRTQLVFLPRQQVLGDTEPKELSRVHAQIPGAGPREASQGGGGRKGCDLHDILQG